jgi:hypothetical protein
MNSLSSIILPPHLQKLIDLGEAGTDILHGELKNLMYECEQELENLSELQDVSEYQYVSGKLDAFVKVYQLTYALAFAISDRIKNNG